MNWMHPGLLFALGLVLLPVVLHLLMKAKPKKLVFPALRLLQARRKSNSKRLRLRHLWLLLLRMLVLAAIVFAVARPRVPAGEWTLTSADWLRLILVGGVCLGGYFLAQRIWASSAIPSHDRALRRTRLKAGFGIIGLLGFLALFCYPYQQRVWASMAQPGVVVDETQPVTAVMLFDVSLSMEYQQESENRLGIAKQIAQRHLSALPRGSRLAVCDTAGDSLIRFATDLSASLKRVAALEIRPVSRTLDERLLAALDAHLEDRQTNVATEVSSDNKDAASEDESTIREIYVFTDLSTTAFRPEPSPRLKEALAALPNLGLYVIDVGIESPTNIGITELGLSDQSVSMGGEIVLNGRLDGMGNAVGEKTVELFIENRAGKMVRQGSPQTVTVAEGSGALVQFPLQASDGPVLQGELRLLASDPLSFDDVRRFTVRVHPPAEILLIAETEADARHVLDALAPAALVESGRAPFRCRVIQPNQLMKEKLAKYSVVALLNVADPTEGGWKALGDYVEEGGSSAIILGDRVKHAAYLSKAALRVLPGELGAALSFKPAEYFDLQNLTHPLLKRFDDWGVSGLRSEPIQKYWRVDPTKDTAVIARYTDSRQGPALIEKALGKGRVLMLTTSLDRRGWNELPVAGWEFVGLVDQMMTYLGRGASFVFNHVAGSEVLLPLEPSDALSACLIRKPGLQQLRVDIPQGVPHWIVKDVDQIGNYRVTSADAGIKYQQGFSVNADGAESILTRMSAPELDERFGKDRYSLARDIDKLRRNVMTGRQGHEVFPFVAFLMLLVFLGEHLVANRFYEIDKDIQIAGGPGGAKPASSSAHEASVSRTPSAA